MSDVTVGEGKDVGVSKSDFLLPLPYYLTGCPSRGTSFEDDLTLGAEGK